MRRSASGTAMGRREFVAGLGAVALAGAARLRAAGRGLDAIGVQLYTVRDLLGGDFYGTIGALAEIGFRELEFAGYYDHDPAEIRARLDDLGLTAPATHVNAAQLATGIDDAIATAGTLGHRYVVCSWVPPELRASLDDWKRLVEQLGTWSEKCRAAGLLLGYHNHDFELKPVEGQLPYDMIVAGTDPERVRLELDLYWVHAAGHDPAGMLRQHAGRVDMVHVKDAAASGGFTEVGAGVIDWPSVLGAAREVGVKHYFVEQDRTTLPPLESVKKSFGYLSKLEF